MWGRKRKTDAQANAAEPNSPLKEAMHQARVEAAERTSVVVDLRDAELARLELLNEALEPLFAEIPPEADLFDRGVSRGETRGCGSTPWRTSPWGATSAAIVFLQDSRNGAARPRRVARHTGHRTGGDRLCRAPPDRTATGA